MIQDDQYLTQHVYKANKKYLRISERRVRILNSNMNFIGLSYCKHTIYRMVVEGNY